MDRIQNCFEMISESLANIDIGSAVLFSLVFAMSVSLLFLLFKKQTIIDDKPVVVPKRQDAMTLTQTPPSVSNPIPVLKGKHKKTKKSNKLIISSKIFDSAEDSISEQSSSDGQFCNERKLSRVHVDFADTVEMVDNVKIKRSTQKKDKIKSILVNKSDKCEKGEIDSPIDNPKVNNFDEIVPKDDVELLRSRSVSLTRRSK